MIHTQPTGLQVNSDGAASSDWSPGRASHGRRRKGTLCAHAPPESPCGMVLDNPVERPSSRPSASWISIARRSWHCRRSLSWRLLARTVAATLAHEEARQASSECSHLRGLPSVSCLATDFSTGHRTSPRIRPQHSRCQRDTAHRGPRRDGHKRGHPCRHRPGRHNAPGALW